MILNRANSKWQIAISNLQLAELSGGLSLAFQRFSASAARICTALGQKPPHPEWPHADTRRQLRPSRPQGWLSLGFESTKCVQTNSNTAKVATNSTALAASAPV